MLEKRNAYRIFVGKPEGKKKEPPIVQPLKNIPAFHGTRRFNTVFTRALHWSLS
jgi:hypothetical protein